MKSLAALTPRTAVLDDTADFVVNLADVNTLTEAEAREFLDSNVLTSGMELLLAQAFTRMAGTGGGSGIYKLSESMGGGKTQSMIVAGILARFPHFASLLPFQPTLPDIAPDVVAAFTGRATDKKVWVALGEALGATFAPDRASSEAEWRDALKDRAALILLDKRVKEVITPMRESQIEAGLARCGYTDTDYLLAAQAAAAEVVTGYASINDVDLESELRAPNAERGRSALRTLMDNAKRTATDFLVPPAMDRAIHKAGGGDAYQFWRGFSPEEKFLLKGLEGEAQGVFKLGAFQDLGRAYGLADYEELMEPIRANDSRTKMPEELPRPDGLRFDELPASDRGLWRHSPTRHIYHALKLLAGGAGSETPSGQHRFLEHPHYPPGGDPELFTGGDRGQSALGVLPGFTGPIGHCR
ncbi:hypothetical protein [Nitrosococcus wardiae]|uniref:DUF499 domain-containing protein n=1 Tax=Nitrosococcus wardiae TaxID=1814290 RepID=A0A4P7BZG5_9GAMM|nr:hypothetical protein [Nitrosococcus wardiae]QBQ53826.1 hypothetical protein E3U44_04345 [Nitrosococcus wardiae]